ncbi:MAG TPA: hypothetical protein VM848_05690 [Acidimicrobiia bacterium]|nr:hypothetical protein [Acidimicrobiia bacterium]
MEIGAGLLFVAVILIAVSIYLSRRRKALQAELGIETPVKGRKAKAAAAPSEPKVDFTHFRPAVAEFAVEGHTARVRFDVPLPDGDDEILSELLVGEAIEVMREKRHSLPLAGVTEVAAEAGRGEVREVGRAKLDVPGILPPKLEGVNILNLSILANDPLAQSFSDAEGGPSGVRPGVAETVRSDELPPLSNELRLPKAVNTGLRAQGIDPAKVSAGELVVGLLRLFGYQVSAAGLSAWIASKAGERTYIVEDSYKPGDHPELDEAVIRRFMVEFSSSGTDRGMLVTDKYGPFEIYTLERREPRVRFVTRDRLQKMVDSLALS